MTIYSQPRRAGKTFAGRGHLITLIHVAKKDLGLDEDTYRSMIEQITGERSLKDLSIDQLNLILSHLKASGFVVKDTPARQLADAVRRTLCWHTGTARV